LPVALTGNPSREADVQLKPTGAAMSEAIITAAAWVPNEPKAEASKEGEDTLFRWTILAEASVSDTDGKPVDKLSKSSWKVHVTAAGGTPWSLPFSVKPLTSFPSPITALEGYYLVRVDNFPAGPWEMPTAMGIAIANRKLGLQGKVVVPVALAGPTVVSTLTTPTY
jgi:hypothetical protein